MASHKDLEERLSKVLQELEESRIRGCQMEKTVRWWTTCTSSWRRKWNKVHRERDILKKELNTLKTQFNHVLKELQNISEKPGGDATIKAKLDTLLGENKPNLNMHQLHSSSSNSEKPADEDEELDMGPADMPPGENKLEDKSDLPRDFEDKSRISDESYKDQSNLTTSMDTRVQTKYRVTRELLDTEIVKNESLVGIMTQELANVVADKKKLHMEIENLRSEKIILKQQLRVQNLQIETLKEQLRIITDPIKTVVSGGLELEFKMLSIENSTLRSQVRDLCNEICIAQEEVDKVSAKLSNLKKRSADSLEQKENNEKGIAPLDKLRICGYPSDEETNKSD